MIQRLKSVLEIDKVTFTLFLSNKMVRVILSNNTALTLSSLQTNTGTFANSADPDETAHNEPSHQDLQCLPFCYWPDWIPNLEQWVFPSSEMEEYISETLGWKVKNAFFKNYLAALFKYHNSLKYWDK